MATFVVCHGAWSASWAWKRMHPLMQAAGHCLSVPCYTGLGERRHLSGPHITLDTHIDDVANHIEVEDLSSVVLVGHSYGGMVATGVADRLAGRISHLVYLDAFVPADGQCAFDLIGPEGRARVEADASANGDSWRITPQPPPPDTTPEDLAWMAPRRLPQPLATFAAHLRLKHGGWRGPKTYIFCTRVGPADAFRPFARAAASDAAWRYREIDASHNPHITCPEVLMALLAEIAPARLKP